MCTIVQHINCATHIECVCVCVRVCVCACMLMHSLARVCVCEYMCLCSCENLLFISMVYAHWCVYIYV